MYANFPAVQSCNTVFWSVVQFNSHCIRQSVGYWLLIAQVSFDLRAVLWNLWWKYWQGGRCSSEYFSFPVSVIIPPVLYSLDQGSQAHGLPVCLCSPCIDIILIIECGWPECWIIYVIFYFTILFVCWQKRLKKVCSPLCRLSINLVSLLDRACGTPCCVGGDCCQGLEYIPAKEVLVG
jgi:hypothetical protein